MIYTNHPDGGAPMTAELLARCYLDVRQIESGVLAHAVKLHPQGDETDDWSWSFATFKARIAEAMRSPQIPAAPTAG